MQSIVSRYNNDPVISKSNYDGSKPSEGGKSIMGLFSKPALNNPNDSGINNGQSSTDNQYADYNQNEVGGGKSMMSWNQGGFASKLRETAQ